MTSSRGPSCHRPAYMRIYILFRWLSRLSCWYSHIHQLTPPVSAASTLVYIRICDIWSSSNATTTEQRTENLVGLYDGRSLNPFGLFVHTYLSITFCLFSIIPSIDAKCPHTFTQTLLGMYWRTLIETTHFKIDEVIISTLLSMSMSPIIETIVLPNLEKYLRK